VPVSEREFLFEFVAGHDRGFVHLVLEQIHIVEAQFCNLVKCKRADLSAYLLGFLVGSTLR